MLPIDYCRKYYLYLDIVSFNEDDFLKDLEKDFLSLIKEKQARHTFTYKMFVYLEFVIKEKLKVIAKHCTGFKPYMKHMGTRFFIEISRPIKQQYFEHETLIVDDSYNITSSIPIKEMNVLEIYEINMFNFNNVNSNFR